jgi:hypothetical protein
MELNPVSKEEPVEEWMQRKRKLSEKQSKEVYPESCGWPRDDLWPSYVNLRWVVFQNADLRGVLQILFQKLGLDLVAHGGCVGIGDLGAHLGLLCGGRGGTSGGRTSLAHDGGTKAGALSEREQRRTRMAGC